MQPDVACFWYTYTLQDALFVASISKTMTAIGALKLAETTPLHMKQKLYGPSRRDGTLLLGPGQDGYTVAGEAFLRLRLSLLLR